MTAESEIPDDPEVLTAMMRREGLQVVHTIFATIHHRSENRPDGWTEEELNNVSASLNSSDLERWKAELRAHFSKKYAK